MKRFVPAWLYRRLAPLYHKTLTYLGAIRYGFPSRSLTVIGVTGTKGKSTTTELLAWILNRSGRTTASTSTVRFAIGETEEQNRFKMTMPGRFFLHRFLRKALEQGATHAVIEMSSEGASQGRHAGIELNALIFTNLSPEHIESHGSLKAYTEAKLLLGKALARSKKRPRIMVANSDDAVGQTFLTLPVDQALPFSLEAAHPYEASPQGSSFTFDGIRITSKLPGTFSIMNMLAAATCAKALSVPTNKIAEALASFPGVPGRAERIDEGQPFSVVVDYAHTPDSLKALLEAYPGRKICLIGSTGGGRDAWKRPEMGRVAELYCDEIIIANEDPYDENPEAILRAVAEGMRLKTPQLAPDRRQGIHQALTLARPGDTVLVTGKGTDPFIMGPRGSKFPWSDASVVREELHSLRKDA